MSFLIPTGAFEHVTPLGATPPAAGYYAVKITKIENHQRDKAHTRRVHCQFENGFSMFEFLHCAYDEEGTQYPGLEEKQVRGRLAALMTILFSLGYTKPQLVTGEVDVSSLLYSTNGGRKAYVEFIPGQKGVQGSFSTIRRFVTEAVYNAEKDKAYNDPTAVTSGAASAAANNGVRAPAPAGHALPSPAQGLIG